MTTTFISSDNLEEFTEQLDPSLNAGLTLQDVEYADGTWVGTFRDDGSNSTWAYDPDLKGLESRINATLEQGYELTDIEYGDGVWFATFDEGFGEDSTYYYNSDVEAYEATIQEWSDQGQGIYRGDDLLDVEYGAGVWFAVFGDELDSSTYISSPDVDSLSADIDSIQEQDYDIVDVEYTNGSWTSVFYEAIAIDTTHTISTTQEEFEQDLTAKLDRGYDVVDLEYGDGVWVTVFDGTLGSTDTNSDSTDSNSNIATDMVIDNMILENSHYAFDPDHWMI